MKFPLVLLSGLLSNQTLWQHQSRYLSDIATIQMISPSQSTPEKMIQAVLDEAPPKFALAGHSMGGWLSLEMMRAAPSRISKLCLLNTTARMDSEEKAMRRQNMIQKVEKGQFHDVVKELSNHLVYNNGVKNTVESMFLEVGKNAFINQEKAMMKRGESQSILPAIACPTLVIHASQDKNFSLLEHQELVNQIQNAKLALVEGSGHMSPMEMPQAITALMRFWLTYF